MTSATGTHWTRDALDAAVDTRFRAIDEMTNSLSLTLIKLMEGDVQLDDNCPPSLLLRGPLRLTWHQDSYTLCHRDLGMSTVTLRPVGRDEDGVYYEGMLEFDPTSVAEPVLNAEMGSL